MDIPCCQSKCDADGEASEVFDKNIAGSRVRGRKSTREEKRRTRTTQENAESSAVSIDGETG